ncbi:MAG TPA: hypothetical protein VLA71_20450 [Algoriphagus sp.]|nr:hypothetical protein [Algoriphagus sp.]
MDRKLRNTFPLLGEKSFRYLLFTLFALVSSGFLKAQVLPKPDATFRGKIDINPKQSTADWPELVKAPEGAPNVIHVLLDDIKIIPL